MCFDSMPMHRNVIILFSINRTTETVPTDPIYRNGANAFILPRMIVIQY